ncbi:hypothetical protein Bbelb_109430 [Branchiostoma belcheri]|nr:hypothetical protein Bbelb_109430 [Branchiostoma belcheri]
MPWDGDPTSVEPSLRLAVLSWKVYAVGRAGGKIKSSELARRQRIRSPAFRSQYYSQDLKIPVLTPDPRFGGFWTPPGEDRHALLTSPGVLTKPREGVTTGRHGR